MMVWSPIALLQAIFTLDPDSLKPFVARLAADSELTAQFSY